MSFTIDLLNCKAKPNAVDPDDGCVALLLLANPVL
jgi:hypothetical protein